MADKLLNSEQKKAVTYVGGSLLIVAGAGTGKTTVIVERIKFLIASGTCKPDEILALTFTDKAAKEMQERVDVALPLGETVNVGTFHAFCDRVLRESGLHVGIGSDYKLLTTAEMAKVVQDNFFSFNLTYFRPLGNPYKFIGGLLNHFSRLQDEDVPPADYGAWVKIIPDSKDPAEILEKQKWEELASAYKRYEELKIEKNVFDYGDLIVKVLGLFKKRPNVLKEYQRKFKYILVDEFQDTNIAQNELIIALAGKDQRVTAILDDDQAIYRFRGTSVSNALQFRSRFPNTKIVTLITNYRSTQKILDSAYKLIQGNNPDRLEVIEKIDKKLVSAQKVKGVNPEFLFTGTESQEVAWVTEKIRELTTKKGGFGLGDIAILVRANAHADSFITYLRGEGIPVVFANTAQGFISEYATTLMAFIKVLADINDSVALFTLLSSKWFLVDSIDLAKMGVWGRKNQLSLFEVCLDVDQVKITNESRQNIGKLVELIRSDLTKLGKESFGAILLSFGKSSGVIADVLENSESLPIEQVNEISRLFSMVGYIETVHKVKDVGSLADWLDLLTSSRDLGQTAEELIPPTDAVTITTVHGSKGLEFPVVFMVNLVEGRFPSIERSEQIPVPETLLKEILPEGDYHMQEERRLFYVGMTRAKERLFLTASKFYREGKRERKISRFVFESVGDSNTDLGIVNKTAISNFGKDSNKEKVEINTKGSSNSKTKIDYLSYSQIETFEICPLHYKLKYILKLPSSPSPSQSIGISVHGTLKELFEEVRKGECVNEMDVEGLLKSNWSNEGFDDKVHEKLAFEKALEFVQGVVERDLKDKSTETVLLEEPFTIDLERNGERIKVGGVIDRVDRLPGGAIEIIDYKTSDKPKTQREVDTDRQLTFYALAATRLQREPFAKLPEEVVLSLYFLKTGEKLSTIRTKVQLEEEMEEIFRIKKEIEESDFKCSGGFFCQDCEYGTLCRTK